MGDGWWWWWWWWCMITLSFGWTHFEGKTKGIEWRCLEATNSREDFGDINSAWRAGWDSRKTQSQIPAVSGSPVCQSIAPKWSKDRLNTSRKSHQSDGKGNCIEAWISLMLDADFFAAVGVFLTEALFKRPSSQPGAWPDETRRWIPGMVSHKKWPHRWAHLWAQLCPFLKWDTARWSNVASIVWPKSINKWGRPPLRSFVAIQPSKDVKVHGRTGNHSLFFCFVDFASRNTQRLWIWRTQPGCMAGKMHHVQVIEGSCTRCPGPTEKGEKDLNTRFPPNI